MIGSITRIISQGVKLGAVCSIAEAVAPKFKSGLDKVSPVIKRGVHNAATCVAQATSTPEDSSPKDTTKSTTTCADEKVHEGQ